MKINTRKKFIIGTGVVVIVNLAFVCLLSFLFVKIGKDLEVLENTKADLAFYNKRIANTNNIKMELQEVYDQRAIVESVFLEELTIVSFIERLEKLANISEIKLVVRRADIKKNSTDKPIFDISTEGPFSNICNFVSLLEKDSYQVSFERLYLQKNESATNWEGIMGLRLLSFK
ncbi:hypothetical protein ACFLZC_01690 [Patescibacteria group bacterium]